MWARLALGPVEEAEWEPYHQGGLLDRDSAHLVQQEGQGSPEEFQHQESELKDGPIGGHG